MRYELTDNEWTAIRPMPNKPRGVPRVSDRRVVNGIFWVLRSGAPRSGVDHRAHLFPRERAREIAGHEAVHDADAADQLRSGEQIQHHRLDRQGGGTPRGENWSGES